jgi:VWFA-related protein
VVYSSARLLRRFILFVGLPVLGILFCTRIHGNQAPLSDKSADKLKIKVDVDEVRLDAVVVDGKGKQITDLTADDFEVYQDRKKQPITSCKYISLDSPDSRKPAGPSRGFRESPPGPVPMPEREDVRRTIVFLINDICTPFEAIEFARMSPRKYVKEQVQEGDLVSIVSMRRGNALFQSFTMDKQELLLRIEGIQWNDPDFGVLMDHEATQIGAINYCVSEWTQTTCPLFWQDLRGC